MKAMVKIKKLIFRSKTIALTICFILLFLGITVYSKELQTAVKDSINYCLTALTPSLFPFMSFVSLAVSSGAAEVLSKPIGLISRYIFRLPECCTVPIILSFLSGYPAGARAISMLLKAKKITLAEAERMICFCFSPGIAFVVSFVGGVLLNSIKTGWLLFASVTVSGLFTGFILSLGKPVPIRKKIIKSKESWSVVSCVYSASKSVLIMCACVILFSGLNAILKACGIFNFFCVLLSNSGIFSGGEAETLFSFILEVTGGAGTAALYRASPEFYAFGLAFGGICVHLQVFAQLENVSFSKLRFLLFRFIHGILSFILCLCLQKLFFGSISEVSAALNSNAVVLSGNAMGGLSVILMSAAFLLYIGRNIEDL